MPIFNKRRMLTMSLKNIEVFNFETGEWERDTVKRRDFGTLKKAAPAALVPFALFTPSAFAQEPAQYIGEKSMQVIAHALDPLVELMVALSFPIASVIMVGACFFFMFNNADKAWDMIMKAGLGYVLLQLSPLFLKILQEVGTAVN
jgi:hypothetical protein